ncbi:uncharacterized protein MYCFIDRAFT_135024 [Pseudocercospora fijiensis CIRAD86]|uniref:Cercosporin MFS transporter CTB4 n=1 Tax=Pseudocercospora fijiensis (strain CIRAD86) TaxID=383855 RepID=M3AHT4_PSEFD|nr:uncharacterized protein MYCFIDRAFT_135024 [Pseudocercospora fijiensis CIRAD86]EME84151.1 hypothetical protein MYCFIDRAFT_135024 [Pseudocercospora fijiensis CIRAD86]
MSRRSVNSDISTLAEIAEKGATAELVDWNGPDDPDNPHNWSLVTRVFITALICILTFSIYIGSAIYATGIIGISEKFNVSHTVATLGLSMFVFGYGLGPMILAPFAEAPPIGRMPVYIITHLAFLFLNFGVVYAKNIGMLLAFRFLTGFFGSPVLALGGSTLADVWSPKKVTYAIGIWGNFAILGPVIGPLVAGFAVQAKGWKWSIWELIWLNAFCAVLLIFGLPETSGDNILLRRAARIRKMTGEAKYRCSAEIEAEKLNPKDLVVMSLVRPFQLLFSEPILLAQNTYLGLIYALLYCWFEAFPLVFGGIYGFDLGSQGLAYLGLLVGCVLFTPPYFYWIHKYINPHTNDDGTIKPEKRLPAAIVGSLFLPVCLFWFGWSSRQSIHWIMPIIGSVFFSVGAGLLFNALLSYQSDAYPKVVGSVLAGNDFMRAAFGGAFPIFATQMYKNMGIDWGCSMLGFLAIAFIPMPILIYKYGERLRMASKFARHDI